MASRQVTDREKSARSVIAAGEANADLVQSALAEQVKPFLEKGEKVPDYAGMIRLSGRRLGAARDHMVTADEAHEQELADDAPAREERDEAQASLRAELVELREMISGVYGGPTAGRLFVGSTPEDPVLLGRFAGEVADAFKRVKLPAPRVKGAKLDVDEIIASLRDGRVRLEGHLEAVQREIREAQQTAEAKNAAIAAYDTLFTSVATTLSGLLRQAGKPDLAARVRPSARSPGQTAEDAGEATDPGK
jgi:hypothetical protein